MFSKFKWNAIYLVVLLAATVTMSATATSLLASTTDDKIESSFMDTYVYRTYLRDDTIKINANKGIVTLTGTVAGEMHKDLARETAASLPGVTRVENKLVTKADVSAANADAMIVTKVKFALLFYRNVNTLGTEVKAKDGVVTLRGEAVNIAQKELTSEYANDIDGVKEVKNEMVVKIPSKPQVQTLEEKVDDASITAQVRIALLTHRSTSALKTEVTTRGGEVTLAGTAKNAAEKALVTKLVTNIKGVKYVKNEMKI
jgi:osmotically-inducible protein OsmY